MTFRPRCCERRAPRASTTGWRRPTCKRSPMSGRGRPRHGRRRLHVCRRAGGRRRRRFGALAHDGLFAFSVENSQATEISRCSPRAATRIRRHMSGGCWRTARGRVARRKNHPQDRDEPVRADRGRDAKRRNLSHRFEASFEELRARRVRPRRLALLLSIASVLTRPVSSPTAMRPAYNWRDEMSGFDDFDFLIGE